MNAVSACQDVFWKAAAVSFRCRPQTAKHPLYTQSRVLLSIENICPRSSGIFVIFFLTAKSCVPMFGPTHMFPTGKQREQKVKLRVTVPKCPEPPKCGEQFRKHARPRKGYTQEGTLGSSPPPPRLLAPPSSHPTPEDLSSVISAKELSLTFELWKFLQTDYAASESGTRQ